MRSVRRMLSSGRTVFGAMEPLIYRRRSGTSLLFETPHTCGGKRPSLIQILVCVVLSRHICRRDMIYGCGSVPALQHVQHAVSRIHLHHV